jgi:biopolymer transport protein ExbD
MRLTADHEPKARFEMIPVMDIMFLMLVFFVYAMLTMVVNRGLAVELPPAGAQALERAETLTITVTAANDLMVDEQPVTLATVADAVRQRLAQQPKASVVISGDRSSDLGVSLGVLDRLRAAGVHAVSFRTAPAAEPAE